MRFVLVLTAAVLIPSLVTAQELPEVNTIMNAAIQRVLEDDKLKIETLTYRKKYVEEDIREKGGRITPTGGGRKEELYNVYSKNGLAFEELVERNGQSPAKDDQTEKMADKRPDIEDILGRNRYNYKLLGVSEYEQRQVYSVSFEPRRRELQPQSLPGDSIKKTAENEILNNMYGTIYVDQENSVILRVEAHLYNPPLRIKTGKLFRFDVTFERELINGISVNKKLTIVTKYSYVSMIWNFFENFERITIIYEDYAPKPPNP